MYIASEYTASASLSIVGFARIILLWIGDLVINHDQMHFCNSPAINKRVPCRIDVRYLILKVTPLLSERHLNRKPVEASSRHCCRARAASYEGEKEKVFAGRASECSERGWFLRRTTTRWTNHQPVDRAPAIHAHGIVRWCAWERERAWTSPRSARGERRDETRCDAARCNAARRDATRRFVRSEARGGKCGHCAAGGGVQSGGGDGAAGAKGGKRFAASEWGDRRGGRGKGRRGESDGAAAWQTPDAFSLPSNVECVGLASTSVIAPRQSRTVLASISRVRRDRASASGSDDAPNNVYRSVPFRPVWRASCRGTTERAARDARVKDARPTESLATSPECDARRDVVRRFRNDAHWRFPRPPAPGQRRRELGQQLLLIPSPDPSFCPRFFAQPAPSPPPCFFPLSLPCPLSTYVFPSCFSDRETNLCTRVERSLDGARR